MKATFFRATLLFSAFLLTGCALGSPVSMGGGLQLRQTNYSNVTAAQNASEWEGATVYLVPPVVEGPESEFGRGLAPEVHQMVVQSLRSRNVRVVRDATGTHHAEMQVVLVVEGNREDGADKRVTVSLELNDAEQYLARGSAVSLMMNNRETHIGAYRPLRTIVSQALSDLYVQPLGYKLATGEPTAVAERRQRPSTQPERAHATSSGPRAMRFASATPQRQSYALVVGVERYRDLPPPTGARSDAETFAALLRETMGIPGENVRVLLDDRATRSDILASLEWLEETVPAGARIYLFFSGHGSPEPSAGTSYLLPYEATPESMTHTGLTLASVLERLEATPAREVFAFVDACFSGMGDRSVLPEGTRPLVPAQAVESGSRVAVFSASQASEISGNRPGQDVGLFTHYLVEALGSGRADLDGDGQISLAELQAYVAPRVAREAREAQRSQTPSLYLADDLGASEDVAVVWGIAPLD